jgi:hypothetical protein
LVFFKSIIFCVVSSSLAAISESFSMPVRDFFWLDELAVVAGADLPARGAVGFLATASTLTFFLFPHQEVTGKSFGFCRFFPGVPVSKNPKTQ